MIAATAPTIPSVKDLTREQRQALMVELVKAWFDDVGMPFPIVVRDGEKVLGVFKPEFHPPEKPTPIEFPAEFMAQIAERAKSERGLTKEEALDYLSRTYERKDCE